MGLGWGIAEGKSRAWKSGWNGSSLSIWQAGCHISVAFPCSAPPPPAQYLVTLPAGQVVMDPYEPARPLPCSCSCCSATPRPPTRLSPACVERTGVTLRAGASSRWVQGATRVYVCRRHMYGGIPAYRRRWVGARLLRAARVCL